MPRLVLLIFVLNALLVGLLVPADQGMPWVAAEALVIAGLFLVLPPRWPRTGLAWGVGALYGLSAVLVLVDSLIRVSLGRPLNLYHDLSIVGASINLLLTNLGLALTSVLGGTILLLCLGLAALLVHLLLHIAKAGETTSGRNLVMGLMVIALAGLAAPFQLVGGTATVIGSAQASQAFSAHQAGLAFRRQVDELSGAGAGTEVGGSVEQLAGTNVVLAFVESYGVSALFDERYRPVVGPSLERLSSAVAQRGLHMVSGRLRSPVQGGQSWLAHSSVLSGLWVESQQDYEALIASRAPTLIDDLRRSGHESVAVMPAITMAWPEGRAMGYDRIYDAGDMEYQGPAFNWVTMPDQYTWSWFHDAILEPADQPVFAELALISSHAPWVPVLPVIEDWSQIGKGGVFRQWQGAGESPASLWQDPERVRAQYAKAMAYSIEVIAGYVAQRMRKDTILIVMGDHQPAPLVTGADASRDVPVHLIGADKALLERFTGTSQGDGLAGFRPGAWPSADLAGPGMNRVRPFVLQNF